MRIIVFGATGGTGRAVVARALAAGHAVTALVRDAAKLPPRAALTIVEGDAMRAADVAAAMEGQDAVVVSLGNSQNAFARRLGARRTTPRDICEVGTRNILSALPDGAQLLVVSAFGVGATRDKLPFMFKLFYRLILREQIADKERQETLLRASGAAFTLVQPVALTDKPPKGGWTASTDGTLGGSELARADLAAFILSRLETPGHSGETFVLSGALSG